MKVFLHIPKTAGSFFKKTGTDYCQSLTNTQKGHFLCNNLFGGQPKDIIESNLCNVLEQDHRVDLVMFRNPFSWLYSYYSHDRSGHDGWLDVNNTHGFKSFDEFIESYVNPNFEWHIPTYKVGYFASCFDNQKQFVPNKIIFYETLKNGLDVIGVNSHGALSGGIQPNKYREHYTDELITLVSDHFYKFNNFIGYDFNGLTKNRVVMDGSEIKWNDVL
jgi:hypothetical protein